MFASRRRDCSRISSTCCSSPTLAETMLDDTQNTITWMRRIAFIAVLLAFGVVALGAYVRLTTAGLGCPDWPGCYGHIAPTSTAVDVGKAWREMIHRYFAGSLVVLTLALLVLA